MLYFFMEKGDETRLWLGVLLILALGAGMYFGVRSYGPGAATGQAISTTSNVTVQVIISAAASPNLINGIEFGSIATLPATDVNATDNYNGGGAPPGDSTLYIAIDSQTNVNVDLCINATAPLTLGAGGPTIPLAGYTFNTATNPNPSGPAGSTSLSLTAQKAGLALTPGQSNYYRYWLDVPGSTVPGDYNNSLSFIAVQAGAPC